MADQAGPSGDSGTTDSRFVTTEEFRAWTQRFEDLVRSLTMPAPTIAIPSTPTTPIPPVPVTQGMETPVATNSTAPIPLAAIPEGIVDATGTQIEAETPPLQTDIVQTTETPTMPIVAAETTPVTTPVTTREKSTKATAEARQWREFKRHDPVKFFGGTDVTAAELFLKNHEKIHTIIATEDHMRATISSSMLQGEADDWWTTIITTRGTPRDWIDFKTQFNQKYFPPTVLRAKRNEFMALRQSTDESVMDYMGRFIALLPYCWRICRYEGDRVYYFTEGLLPTIGGSVVTTQPETLQIAYERSLARESYLLTHPDEVRANRAETRSDSHYQQDRKRKRSRWENREHRAQSVGSVAQQTTRLVQAVPPCQALPVIHRSLIDMTNSRRGRSLRTGMLTEELGRGARRGLVRPKLMVLHRDEARVRLRGRRITVRVTDADRSVTFERSALTKKHRRKASPSTERERVQPLLS
ncbi:hypothetical protein Sjap_022422 [Stephania japonica]|uniref:Retrotransposon gag domain-containing protein n=1 Tax=Stephania japonica TaxID=461633 RepID=A0AAP0ENV4_9MAGN